MNDQEYFEERDFEDREDLLESMLELEQERDAVENYQERI